MNVELVSCTPNALELLIYTKGTRLEGNYTLLDIVAWPYKRKMEELEYMKKTIQSSFEFVDYVFKLSGVSRTFTHQLVRSRHNSYQQEAMRAVDVRDHGYNNTVPDQLKPMFENVMDAVFDTYADMIDQGVPRQDAREMLPTGIHTTIMVKANLRSLSQMAELRLCKRVQGEYQRVFKEMRDKVCEIHPWADDFLQVACVKTGICIFPNYTECPVQEHTVKVSDHRKNMIKEIWANTVHEANPEAKDGRA